MKKDIEWLKKEIATEMIELEPNRKERWSDVKYQTLRSVAQKIYQLDEPEVLSQEWIEKNVVHVKGLGDIIEAEVIENLLVPKQELPVIPKFVAEWIVSTKYNSEENLRVSLNNAPSKVNSWLWEDNAKSNFDIYARAWLDGYTVEEEPLYYALIKGHELVNDEGEWSTKYWNLWVSGGCVFPHDKGPHTDDFLTTMSKEEWGKWGINDTNADFIKVEEIEE